MSKRKYLTGSARIARDAEIRKLYDKGRGWPVSALAKKFGLSDVMIYKITSIGADGAILRSFTAAYLLKVRQNDAERVAKRRAIVTMYLEGKTLSEVADAFKVTRERIRQVLVREGVQRRHYGNPKRKPGPDAAEEERSAYLALKKEAEEELRQWNAVRVRADYDAGMTYPELLAKYQKSVGWVLYMLGLTGGPTRGGRQVPGKERFKTSMLSEEQKKDIAWRYATFENAGKIAADHGISNGYVINVAKALGYGRGVGPGVKEHFQKKLMEKRSGRSTD